METGSYEAAKEKFERLDSTIDSVLEKIEEIDKDLASLTEKDCKEYAKARIINGGSYLKQAESGKEYKDEEIIQDSYKIIKGGRILLNKFDEWYEKEEKLKQEKKELAEKEKKERESKKQEKQEKKTIFDKLKEKIGFNKKATLSGADLDTKADRRMKKLLIDSQRPILKIEYLKMVEEIGYQLDHYKD